MTRPGPPKQKNHPRMGVIFEKVAESLLLVLDRSLGGGEAGDGDAEGAAGDVGQADLVAECRFYLKSR